MEESMAEFDEIEKYADKTINSFTELLKGYAK